jgi:hypothetical protein
MTRLEQNLRWSHSLRAAGTIHSYAYSRQLANSNTTDNGRPDLSFGNNPHWQRFPELPPLSAYTSARDSIARLSGRPEELEGDDLVLATVAPTGQAAAITTSATDYTTLGVATFAFIGPGTVTVTYSEAFRGSEVLSFGAGRHEFTILHNAVTTWSGGTLFLRAYPQVRLDPSVGGQRWAYIPRIVRGKVRASSNSRLTLIDATSRKDIVRNFAPFADGTHNPQTLVPGVARVDNINTRGTHVFGNLSPYVSPSPTAQLMPRALAARESLSFVESPSVAAAAPVISGVPTISGTAEVGQTLTASPASVTGSPTPARSWQWLRDGLNISGATSSTYTLVSADAGADVSVRQAETNAIGSDDAESAAVEVPVSEEPNLYVEAGYVATDYVLEV